MWLLLACAEATPLVPFRIVKIEDVVQPTAIVEPARGPRGLYVTEQTGRILRLQPYTATPPTVVVDLSDRIEAGGEMGLLGLAFAPTWPDDPRIFVNYTYRSNRQLRTRIASFRMSADGATADPASEVEVLSFDQPYSNHNSGAMAVGPDGMLYLGVGDGGSGGDPQGHAQDRGDWLGSILRVDFGTVPYAVPKDNPFVGVAGVKPEIWAYGVRNPWGMHFDRETLWFADVGQDTWEEVNKGVRGGNYGWNVREASHCYKAVACTDAGFVAPMAEYDHSLGASVTGGLVYRGPSIPALDGRYVYADFATGRMWALPTTGGTPVLVGMTGTNPSTFGADREGRLYIGDYRGAVYRVADSPR